MKQTAEHDGHEILSISMKNIIIDQGMANMLHRTISYFVRFDHFKFKDKKIEPKHSGYASMLSDKIILNVYR